MWLELAAGIFGVIVGVLLGLWLQRNLTFYCVLNYHLERGEDPRKAEMTAHQIAGKRRP